MANNILDLDCVKGETFTLSLELSTAGVAEDLTDYVVYFAIVEHLGMPPVIDVKSTDVGQTIITVTPLAGKIEICVPYTQMKLEFLKGRYSVGLKNSVAGSVNYLLLGNLDVITPAQLIA